MTQKFNKKQIDYLQENFNYNEDDKTITLETWTDGGVDMFIDIYKDNEASGLERLTDFYNNFDIDEEIDLYRQDERYREAFTISQSLNDFTKFCDFISDTLIELARLQK